MKRYNWVNIAFYLVTIAMISALSICLYIIFGSKVFIVLMVLVGIALNICVVMFLRSLLSRIPSPKGDSEANNEKSNPFKQFASKPSIGVGDKCWQWLRLHILKIVKRVNNFPNLPEHTRYAENHSFHSEDIISKGKK